MAAYHLKIMNKKLPYIANWWNIFQKSSKRKDFLQRAKEMEVEHNNVGTFSKDVSDYRKNGGKYYIASNNLLPPEKKIPDLIGKSLSGEGGFSLNSLCFGKKSAVLFKFREVGEVRYIHFLIIATTEGL